MTVHRITSFDNSIFDTTNAHNGDIFNLMRPNIGAVLYGLNNTTLNFLSNNDSATMEVTGPITINDHGQGNRMTFMSGDGLVTINDFQHDATGYIRYMLTASKQGHFTATSDGHGGTYLLGVNLTVHVVGDNHVTDAQHS